MTNYGAKVTRKPIKQKFAEDFPEPAVDRPASPDGIAKTPMDKSDILYCKDLRFKPTT